jgi:lipoprotein-anchoring transpeptidase ErfK/SrfK
LLIGGSVAVYAYDASHNDKIAEGITVAGVDVGGLKKAAAAKAVADRVDGPLQTTIRIKWAGKTYHLSAKRTHARANIDETVQQALDKSDGGNIISRTKRNITGGKIDADIPVDVSYDESSVDRLAAKIEKRVDRKPIDASIQVGGPEAKPFHTVQGKDGVQLDTDQLKQRLRDEIIHPTPKRLVKASVTHTEPKVTSTQLAKKYPTILAVDRATFQLRLYKDFKLKKTYSVAVGQQGLDTPAGLYHIQNKAVNPAWSVPHSAWTGSLAGKVIPGGAPNNPLKARWLGIFDGAGIHGVDPSEYGSIGHAASHGCVRMRIDDVIELYDQVPVGAPIYIS